MITVPAYQGKTVGVFGLARSGIASVHSLVASGATVLAWDDRPHARDAVKACAIDLYAADFASLDALVLAPGVPLTHPEPHPLVKKAQAAGVPIICDLDLFQAARETLPAHKVVGITGTNGKSTTTALIGHILRSAGLPVAVGGNIGTGVLSLDPVKAGGVYVFELSSFQLDLCQRLSCDIGVLLNISPDHLDRHGSMDRYVAAKRRLFDLQDPDAVAVVGVDDRECQAIQRSLPSAVAVSASEPRTKGIFVREGEITDTRCQKAPVGSIADVPSLQGAHNWQNAAAAYVVCQALGVDVDAILNGLSSFPGLAHRQEMVPFRRGVRVVNDSKATNVDSAIRALTTFDHIRWIAGGRSKDRDFSGLTGAVSAVRKAYLMGEDAALIAADLPKTLPSTIYATMRDALSDALADAETGDTVLLSPACTAFDQFADFEKRGDAFKHAVAEALGGQQ